MPAGSAARPRAGSAQSAPVQARAPPSAASVICCRCLAQLAILFLRPRIPRSCVPVWLGRIAFYTVFVSDLFCAIFAWHDMIFAWRDMVLLDCAWHVPPPNPEVFCQAVVRGDGAGAVSKPCRKARSAEQAQCRAGVRRTDNFFARPVHRSSLAILRESSLPVSSRPRP